MVDSMHNGGLAPALDVGSWYKLLEWSVSSSVRRGWGRMGKYRLRVICIAAKVLPGAWRPPQIAQCKKTARYDYELVQAVNDIVHTSLWKTRAGLEETIGLEHKSTDDRHRRPDRSRSTAFDTHPLRSGTASSP